ncbi:hypothetical protein A9C19_00030 [Bacillus weihaiensis]|nr:hypothetical protein A9C19_00030 [Bacillus weihaiensis]
MDETVFVNGQRVHAKQRIHTGDEIVWPFMSMTLIEDDFIQVDSVSTVHTSLPVTKQPDSEMKK